MPDTNDTLISVPRHVGVTELAKYLGLSRWTIFRMCDRREIPFTAYGKIKKFDMVKIAEWVAKRTVPGKT